MNLRTFSIRYSILIYHYKGPTTNVNFNYLTHAATLFDEFTSSRIKLASAEKKPKSNLNRSSVI